MAERNKLDIQAAGCREVSRSRVLEGRIGGIDPAAVVELVGTAVGEQGGSPTVP